MIGLFDSGVGGLTLLRELATQLPNHSFFYFADTAFIPYGNKSPETILSRGRAIAQFLKDKGSDLILIACHTASVYCASTLREEISIPLLDLISPSLDLIPQKGKLALLATLATIQSGAYTRLIQAKAPDLEVIPVACPLFVPLAEEGLFDHPLSIAAAHHYLHPLQDLAVPYALLACTHYPLLEKPIQRALGRETQLLNPTSQIVQQVGSFDLAHDVKRQIHFAVSGNPDTFWETARFIMDVSRSQVYKVTVPS